MKQNQLLWGAVVLLGAAVVVLLLLLERGGFTAGPAAPTPSPTPNDPIVAEIGGETIHESELQDQLKSRYGPELLKELLNHKAEELEAKARKLSVDPAEIDTELKRMMQGYDSEDDYYRSMQQQLGMTKQELRQDVYYRLLLDKIATADVVVTDQEVDAYMNEHPEEFKDKVQLHLREIVNQTLDQAKHTIDLAHGGADFAGLARDRSLDTETANDGGDLGWVEEDDPFLPAAVMKAARALQPGQISDPIKVDNGYAVVKLVERKVQPRGDLQALRDSVRRQLALQKAPSTDDVLASLRKKWKASILSPAYKQPSS